MPTSTQSPRSGLAAFGAALLAAALLPATAHADGEATTPAAVTTQACLGDFATFLTCPAGASVFFGSECRTRELHGGNSPGEHWSGSQRQGPALFFRGAINERPAKDAKISFAANYKNHKKNGRIYRFDKEGRLASWENVIDDKSYGLAVTCNPDGTVAFLANFAADRVVGISRSWRKDGSLSYAIDHDPDGKRTTHLEPGAGLTPELIRRPNELCRPTRCDINAKPDLSAMPKGVSVPAQP